MSSRAEENVTHAADARWPPRPALRSCFIKGVEAETPCSFSLQKGTRNHLLQKKDEGNIFADQGPVHLGYIELICIHLDIYSTFSKPSRMQIYLGLGAGVGNRKSMGNCCCIYVVQLSLLCIVFSCGFTFLGEVDSPLIQMHEKFAELFYITIL